MKHEYSKLKLPETVYPGLLGGVIAPMATNGTTVFVPVVNHPVTFAKQTEPQETGPVDGRTGGAERGDRRGRVGATSSPTRPSARPRPSTTSCSRRLSTATLYAFDASTGRIVTELQLPAGTNTGVAVDGNTLIAPAGVELESSQTPEIAAYRLAGGG